LAIDHRNGIEMNQKEFNLLTPHIENKFIRVHYTKQQMNMHSQYRQGREVWVQSIDHEGQSIRYGKDPLDYIWHSHIAKIEII
jgi:hypothetical protein